MPYKDKFADDLNDFDYGSDDDEMDGDFDDEQKGPRTLKMIAEAKEIRNIMEASGWLDAPVDGVGEIDLDRVLPELKSRMEWINIIKHQRMELTANKLANLPPASESQKNRPIVSNGIKY
ncbi:hypothetical protein C8F04DRAFT_1194054 [Mycena alexandri]|uniref:Uncharacterized protein n=1 Tax=Mycena alexandri TaxID=1745969 RepID=A0AAD6WTH0_9AGAR|nr:hypothetical protein C8F04DRAFT_1194054 [Mycena alexandri]